MKKVLILGGSGMLGAALVKWFSNLSDHEVIATSRSGHAPTELSTRDSKVQWLKFNVDCTDVEQMKDICSGFDLVINAIGRIKQRIRDESLVDKEATLRANTVFSVVLAQAAEFLQCKVVQIATDCVFSGGRGSYIETDKHDASDLYGVSKSLGEVKSANVYNLRCSIVGLELQTSYSLLNWFLGQPNGATVTGYTNHYWNGITALHFAKICAGLLASDRSEAFDAHVVPENDLTKYELLKVFADAFGRSDINIVPTEAVQRIDRTLATVYPNLNNTLWSDAGYSEPPSIQDMVAEIAAYAKAEK